MLAAHLTFGIVLSRFVFVGSLIGLLLGAVLYSIGQRLTRRALTAAEFRACPRCGYTLRGLPRSGTCPECGDLYTPDGLRAAWSKLLERRL